MAMDVPIGIDDFRKIREGRLEYVDKSHLIRELVDKRGVEVALFPRPRRFGKTVNLSMLRWFFERRDEDLSRLFEGLHIWSAGESYRAHFQRYPVVHLSFKGVKSDTYDACVQSIRQKIEVLFDEHRGVLESGTLSAREARAYQAILDGTASLAVYSRSLLDLSAYLRGLHGEQVVILIDEYDEPIHAGYAFGYAPKIIDFFRAFFTEGLKGNPHLFKAVLTGVLRVARESIFSGLNNIAAYSLLREDFSTCFGFTEPEVLALLDKAGRGHLLDAVRAWYDGYVFGETLIYNPWSILCYLESRDDVPAPYWVTTSSNDLIRDVLIRHATELAPAIESLVEGGSVERLLDEHVALGELSTNQGALWSLLVFSGYLKAERRVRGAMEEAAYALSIPNREVRKVYTGTSRHWMESRLTSHGGSLTRMTEALLGGDAERFEAQLQAFVASVHSYNDPAVADPEQVYQGFVLGLLAVLEPEYQVRSNRESGLGRPDVMIRPTQPGKPGVVLELKVARGRRTLDQALEEGLAQIREGNYAAELRAAGASPVHTLAVAFDGKVVRVAAAA